MLCEKLKNKDFVEKNRKLLDETVKNIEPVSKKYIAIAQKRQNSLVKPPGSLGKLEDISIRLAGIYESEFYETNPKIVLAFGADHGIYEEGISSQPQEVTALAIANYTRGICSIGVLSRFSNSTVVAYDVGINTDDEIEGVIDCKIRKGTDNFAKTSAMSKDEAVLSICIGISETQKHIKKGIKVIGLGEMGICNTSPSSAIISILTKKPVEKVTGLGAGTTNETLALKIAKIKQGIEVNKPKEDDAIDILSKVGGFEIGAMVGVILACADKKIPVVLDGFISYAAALLAKKLAPYSAEYMLASHKSSEPASSLALESLGLSASLDMDMRLGEGSGAALFFMLIDAAYEVYTKVATFENSGVPIEGCETDL